MNNTTRREFVTKTAALALLSCRGSGLFAAAEKKRLNILYIMTDDHAAHAIGAYGSRINKTPHIDRLAREGIKILKILIFYIHLRCIKIGLT